jgi:hypothetical protein
MITSYPFVIFNRRCWLLGIFVLAGLMCGCSGAPYGITKKEWSTLTLPQVQELQENYQRIKDLRLEEKSWQERSKITASTPKLEIIIEEGTVQMPPFVNATTYKPVKLIVYQGHCRSVKLLEKSGKKKTELEACYLGDILYLDPSKTVYQWRHGSLRFYYMPIWQSGFRYSDISSQGYVAFKNATVKIKALVLPEV